MCVHACMCVSMYVKTQLTNMWNKYIIREKIPNSSDAVYIVVGYWVLIFLHVGGNIRGTETPGEQGHANQMARQALDSHFIIYQNQIIYINIINVVISRLSMCLLARFARHMHRKWNRPPNHH